MRDNVYLHRMHIADMVALIVLAIGGLNWLLVGIFNWDMVANTFGELSMPLARLVYVAVGAAAIYTLVRIRAMSHFRIEESEPTVESGTR